MEVPSERSLFVGPGDGAFEPVFAATARKRRGGSSSGTTSAVGGQQRFAEGQTVELSGVIRPVPETADEAFRRFGLGREQFELVRDEEVFIRASRVTVTGGG